MGQESSQDNVELGVPGPRNQKKDLGSLCHVRYLAWFGPPNNEPTCLQTGAQHSVSTSREIMVSLHPMAMSRLCPAAPPIASAASFVRAIAIISKQACE